MVSRSNKAHTVDHFIAQCRLYVIRNNDTLEYLTVTDETRVSNSYIRTYGFTKNIGEAIYSDTAGQAEKELHLYAVNKAEVNTHHSPSWSEIRAEESKLTVVPIDPFSFVKPLDIF